MFKSKATCGDVQIGYCPRCNVPVLGKRCDVCGKSPLPLRFHDLGDIRPISKEEMRVLLTLIPFKEVRNYIKRRVVLLSKQPGLDYRRDVYVDGFRIGTMEYIKDGGWRYRFTPTGKGAALFLSLVGEADLNISGRGHLKGKKLNMNIDEDWKIARANECVAVLVPAANGAKVRDVFCRKVSIKKRTNMEDVISVNLGHLAYLERRALDVIRRNHPNYVAFSGGKDSEVALYLASKVGVKRALFANTGMEFPETERFVYNFADYLGIELIELKPKREFWSLVVENGIPTKDGRWCTKYLKIESLKRYRGVIVEGTRKYESLARMSNLNGKRIGNLRAVYPIRDWLALEVWMFIFMKSLPYNPLYDMGYERIGCYMCPSMLNAEFHRLRRTHPSLFRRWYEYLKKQGFSHDEIMDGAWRWQNLPPKIREIMKS